MNASASRERLRPSKTQCEGGEFGFLERLLEVDRRSRFIDACAAGLSQAHFLATLCDGGLRRGNPFFVGLYSPPLQPIISISWHQRRLPKVAERRESNHQTHRRPESDSISALLD
jgi:hypothetical protein